MAENEKKAVSKSKISPKKFVSRIGRFFKDMKGELKKVVWPNKKQVLNNTLVVIVVTVAAAVVIGLFDFILSLGVNFFLRGA